MRRQTNNEKNQMNIHHTDADETNLTRIKPATTTMKLLTVTTNNSSRSRSISSRTNKMTLIYVMLMTLIIINVQSANSSSRSRNHKRQAMVDYESSPSSSTSVFLQLPFSNPPTVKPPPYYESDEKCPAMNLRENWIDTLCGDLNAGYIPRNPMGHSFDDDGSAYPFELIKNKTLDFFRRALPILKSDKSLPKVAKFNPYEVTGLVQSPEPYHYRMKRSAELNSSLERLTWLLPPAENISTSVSRSSSGTSEQQINDSDADEAQAAQPRSSSSHQNHHGVFGFGSKNSRRQYNRFCETSNPSTPGALTYFNRFCKLYNSMWGKTPYQSHYNGPTLVPPALSSTNNVHRYFDHHGNGNNNDLMYQHRIIHNNNNGPFLPSTTFKRAPQPPPAQLLAPFSQRPHRYEALHSSDAKIELSPPLSSTSSAASMPPTPCPSQVEYLTPVFARNHEGAWRYIVQIPREGYFTQTVEVTKCVESSCFYMDGDCKSSPRWQSLLVAEMYYPDTSFPTTTTTTTTPTTTTPPAPKLTPSFENSNEHSEYHKYQQYLKKKRGRNSRKYGDDGGGGSHYDKNSVENHNNHHQSKEHRTSKETSDQLLEIPPECDGIDHIGCFQVRLFYDWFLIPGSCKCWKRTFDFTRVHTSNNRLHK